MYAIAICDDVAADGERLLSALTNALLRRGQKAKIVLYPCGETLLADLEDEAYAFDLIFLDIYMTGLNGVETARRLREMGQKMPLVFLTSSPDFAVEGYDVAASGYLLKPLDEGKLAALLDRLFTPPLRPRLVLECGAGRQYFDYDALCYIESQGHTLLLHTADGATVRAKGKLVEIEAQLHDERFLRCHQSYLVNMDHVYRAEEDFLMRNGERVPIRVRSRKAMTDAYYRYFVERTVEKEGAMSHV